MRCDANAHAADDEGSSARARRLASGRHCVVGDEQVRGVLRHYRDSLHRAIEDSKPAVVDTRRQRASASDDLQARVADYLACEAARPHLEMDHERSRGTLDASRTVATERANRSLFACGADT